MEFFKDYRGFVGKNYLVVGGLSGIGLSVSRAISNYGGNVFAASRRASNPSNCTEIGLRCLFLDVTNSESIQNVVESIPVLDGGLVYCPAFNSNLSLFYQEPDLILETHFRVGPFGFRNLIKPLIKKKKLCGGSSVVVIGAIAECNNPLASSSYSSSKSALMSLARSYALDLASKKKNIRVNSVSYGYVRGGLSAVVMEDQMKNNCILEVPTPDQPSIWGPVLFLLSDRSKWLSGETIVVDGGTSMKGGRIPY
jgi:NAD(P)-dependent dehydrogenase (short-subunit alcohol dehydrogenase family)